VCVCGGRGEGLVQDKAIVASSLSGMRSMKGDQCVGADNARRGGSNCDGSLRPCKTLWHLQAQHPRGAEAGPKVPVQGVPHPSNSGNWPAHL
jgi:hypothetical protein